MIAIRVHTFGGPEVLIAETLAVPEPGPGELRIRVAAAGVNPVETYIRSGNYPALPELPYTPGSDASGVVDAVGDDTSPFRPGDRVYTWGARTGTYAEYAVVAARRAARLPPSLDDSQGAAIGIPYATAHRALFHRGQLRSGEIVLVHGASGGVGIAAVQLARASGARVLGTAGTPQGLDAVRNAGAAWVTSHAEPGHARRILEQTGGRGVDLIVELAAHVQLAEDLSLLAPGGRVAVVGCRGPITINPRDSMRHETDIRGVMLSRATEAELAAIHAGLAPGFASGALRPVVGNVVPLQDAPDAHRRVLEPGHAGKLVLLTPFGS